ncbi:MAG: hypothetical protein ABIW34_09105 [Ginsengibacter sp.]
MNKQRQKNETEFESWIDKEDGGRIYSFEIAGKLGWKAKYLKEVDSEEVTIKFWQEIYNQNNILKEIHEKYPVDKGHKKL